MYIFPWLSFERYLESLTIKFTSSIKLVMGKEEYIDVNWT